MIFTVSFSNIYRITEGWRLEAPLRDHLVQPPYSKQVQLQQVAQGRIQASFEYLQRWRLHNVSGQHVPVSDYPHSKIVFSYIQVDFPGPSLNLLWLIHVSLALGSPELDMVRYTGHITWTL